jgi:membrane protease YdiL (CAAX protease family)
MGINDKKEKSEFSPSTSSINFNLNRLLILGFVYIAAIGIAEYVCNYLSGVAGIIVYFIILTLLIYTGMIETNQSQRKLWFALSLVPVIRIVGNATPLLPPFNIIVWYLVISVPIVISIIIASRIIRFNINDVGLNWNYSYVQIIIGIVGIGLGIVAYIILKPEALTNQLSIQIIFFPVIILMLLGMLEEVIFRGVIQKASAVIGSYDWIFVAVIYTATQIGQRSILYGLFTFLVGLIFGWFVKKTRSVTGVGIAHGLINVCAYIILPHIFIR